MTLLHDDVLRSGHYGVVSWIANLYIMMSSYKTLDTDYEVFIKSLVMFEGRGNYVRILMVS